METGDTVDEKSVGEWVYWRIDGTLYSRLTYDAAGKRDGRVERYHPGGDGGVLPAAQRVGPFLRVDTDLSNGYVLANGLRGHDGESPFFMLYHDDAPFYLAGRATEEWICGLLEGALRDRVGDVERAFARD